MIRGPCDYVPPVEVSRVKYHPAIPLDQNEGIYVRDTKTGSVRAIVGETYMLTEHEELWEKHMRDEVQHLLDDNKVFILKMYTQSSKKKCTNVYYRLRMYTNVYFCRITSLLVDLYKCK